MKSIAEIFRSYAMFDAEGKHVNGTDKQSNHNYGQAYEDILTKPDYSAGFHEVEDSYCSSVAPNRYKSIRDEVKIMMEIGVADGSSLLAWRDIFPNALIVGMDIHHSDKAHGNRIEFHRGDQRLLVDCKRAAAGRQFDMIVEDATHRLEDSLCTLLFMWPFVKPGGLYVIEEFDNVGALRANIHSLFHPKVDIYDTKGPFGGIEPLVVLRK